MNWRKKLADWITGGTYGHACDFADEGFEAKDILSKAEMLGVKYQQALHQIASIPVNAKSNGMLRKAVRIAKETLE